MANLICVRLNKGDAPSWGFRLQGGKDFGTPLVVQKIIGGSPAERAGLIAGDTVIKINNIDVYNLRHKDAQDVILRAGHSFDVAIQRGGSTWKPAVTPVGSISSPRHAATVNNISPVTHTSLAAGRQESIGAIGTSHNVAAKPYHHINGGPKLVNKQYNSPLPIYSEQSIAETLSAQTEVLANGVLGVNFKKNEKTYTANNSEVFRMVHEADKEPRDYESEPDTASSGVVTTPLGIVGLRHVSAPEHKPAPPTQQLPPGQNICADCERLIVGVFVRIKDKNLHVECFKCATCGTSLKNVGYYNLNNKLYCDVHAKLAARNNPPAPNLQPITVPPGGKIPAGTISSALSSHSLPSPSSLSPNTNYSAAPYQSGTNFSGSRPFSSVTAPLSPSSQTSKLSPTYSPYTGRSGIKSGAPYRDSRSVHNIVWPPLASEPELPTASPLYFPPPSQVHPHQKLLLENAETNIKDLDSEYNEQEEMSYINEFSNDRNMSLCSSEVYNITERRSAMECSEAISDTIDRQILVESIVHSRPKSPPPIVPIDVKQKAPPPTDVNVSFTITEAQLKQGSHKNIDSCTKNEVKEIRTSLKETQSQTLASMYEKKIKVENTIPHKWESSMVTALTVASEKPYSHLSEATELHSNNFLEMPAKKSNSALAAALVVAPAVPFTPASNSTLQHVPLPEETVPYFPPEHPIIIEAKPGQDEKTTDSKPVKTKSFGKTKTPVQDDLFQDLPTPSTERISMLAALTTAPDRPYSPFNADAVTVTTTTSDTESSQVETCTKTDLHQIKKQVVTKSLDDLPMFKASVKPVIRSYVPFPTKTDTCSSIANVGEATQLKEKSVIAIDEHSLEQCSKSETSRNVQSTENVTNVCAGLPPMIQVVRSTFETGTDKVQMEMSCQFVGDAPIQKQIIEKCTSTDINEQKSVEKITSERHKESCEITNKQTQPQKDRTLVSAPKQELTSVVNADVCQRSAGITESCMLQKACDLQKTEQLQYNKTTEHVHTYPSKEPITVIEPGQSNLHLPKFSFRTVHEDERSSTSFSPRPGSLTPSMINKPAPVLPYYQASLVATQCTPAETNIFDPASPAVSRSPSPYLARPSSPFPTPSSAARPVSPAQGPPPNPLQSNKSVFELKQEGKVQDARSHVQTFIPQHQSRVGKATLDYYKGESSQQSQTFSESVDNKNVSIKQNSKQEHMYEMGKTEGKSFECTRDGNIQIERKTRVTEEYEHTHKSKEVQIERIATGSKMVESQQMNKAVTDGQAVVGFHITNPQPLKSPFINTADAFSTKTANSEVQSKIPKKIPQIDVNHTKATQPNANSQASVPIPTTSMLSNKNVTKPNVSQPNIGTGGGRQAGAVGVAPRRGRGTLNIAPTPGSRVPLCAQCNANIRGPFITALGKIWCPDHFICATPSCRRPLHDLGFVEEHGQLYCEYCFEQYLAPPCSKCNAKIKGDCLKAIGRNFHPECFNCVYCGKLFGNSPFFLEDAQPYCEADWNELFTTKCFACGFPVEAGDRWVEALSNNYHSQCFNCTMCKKNLEGQSFFAKGGRPFCKNHAR